MNKLRNQCTVEMIIVVNFPCDETKKCGEREQDREGEEEKTCTQFSCTSLTVQSLNEMTSALD